MLKCELLGQVRSLSDESGNVVKRLEMESLTEEMAADISMYTGMDSYDVCVIIECLRRYEEIHRQIEGKRRTW